MAPALDISVPTATTTTTAKPYTTYSISLSQPLRKWSVEKRYSDFVSLHNQLVTQCNNANPPAPLPQKSWFKSTVSSPEMTDDRRRGLETYLCAINEARDTRWRNCPAWRSFLNLPSPSAALNGDGLNSNTSSSLAQTRSVVSDPSVWLDIHRDLKQQLRDARIALTRRDQATTAQVQHEASADVQRNLVRSSTTISSLERSLQLMSGQDQGGRDDKRPGIAPRIGEGEARRRRDLLSSAKKERDGLDEAVNSMALRHAQAGSEAAAAPAATKANLFQATRTTGSSTTARRVLGAPIRETERTRELDNAGVLQLQKQIMQEQDEDVTDLTKVVQRMKEMGIQVNDELELQNEMLGLLGQDVDRVGDKVNVAKKRIAKIK